MAREKACVCSVCGATKTSGWWHSVNQFTFCEDCKKKALIAFVKQVGSVKGKKLGKTQAAVLEALQEHGSWRPGEMHGWVWTTESETLRILRRLVALGFAIEEHGRFFPAKPDRI